MTLPTTTFLPLPPGPFEHGRGLQAHLRRIAVWLGVAFLALFLTACIGDGDETTAPAISTQPASVTVTSGASASFEVAVTGTAPFTYQWRRNGTVIDGAATASYRVYGVTAADTGSQFSVVVSNAAGSVTSEAATLTVDNPVAPALTAPLAAQAVTAGTTATFSVTATGSDPLQYQWKRNGVDIAGANAASYTTPATTVDDDDGAAYAVVVSNAAGSATSDAVRLTVTTAAVPASITTPPVAQTVTVGQTATFTVAAEGTSPLTYQWQRNGVAIAGATAASYTTVATTVEADNGAVFSVVVNNPANVPVTSSAAALTVGTADVAVNITVQPNGASVNVGQAASFTVAAAGTAPQYQWQRDGTAIAGATSPTYTIANVALSDNGALYTVVVSNSQGAVISGAAVLNVASAQSSLAGRAWTTGQQAAASLLPSGGASALATATAIDAQGRVMVLFDKLVGDRVTLQAMRGEPGPTGGSPVFGAPVVIDAAAPFDWSSGVTLAVSPGGNAIAGWVSRSPCTATTYNTNTSATCNYYYNARYLVATGMWEAPRLVNDMYIPAFVPSINDAGDVAALLSQTDLQSTVPQLVVGWRANGQADYTRRAWPADINGTFIPHGVTLDSAGRLLVAGTMTQPLSNFTDIAVYRGTVGSGLGASEIVDLRGATASFLALQSNPAGQAVLMWSQDNGNRATVYAATLDAANAAWTVTDTGQAPPAVGAVIPTALSADGDFIWYFFGRCAAQRRTAGTWSGAAALPASLCQSTGVPGTPALARNGNFITLHPTDGSWLAYDAKLNQAFNPLPHADSGPGYLLGFQKSMSSLPGTLLLADNGIGTYVSFNTYSALPTAAVPNGDSQGVTNAWAWTFK